MKAPNWTFKFDPFLVQIWLKIDPILSKICEPEEFGIKLPFLPDPKK